MRTLVLLLVLVAMIALAEGTYGHGGRRVYKKVMRSKCGGFIKSDRTHIKRTEYANMYHQRTYRNNLSKSSEHSKSRSKNVRFFKHRGGHRWGSGSAGTSSSDDGVGEMSEMTSDKSKSGGHDKLWSKSYSRSRSYSPTYDASSSSSQYKSHSSRSSHSKRSRSCYRKSYGERSGSGVPKNKVSKRKTNKYRKITCDPVAEILQNHNSQYYKLCGRRLKLEERQKHVDGCTLAKKEGNSGLHAYLAGVRRSCMMKFKMNIKWECPAKKYTPENRYRVCKDGNKKPIEEPDDGEIVLPEPPREQCDICQAFTEGSVFMETCGKKINDPAIIKTWHVRCRAECVSREQWNILETMITSYCLCMDNDWEPDWCGRAPKPPTTTQPPNKDCVVGTTDIPFGTKDIIVENCSKRCSCITANQPECEPIACDLNANCVNKDDGEGEECKCTDDHQGNGFICIEIKEECEDQIIDLIVATDTSGSISPTGFSQIQDWLKYLALSMDWKKTNLGIIVYSDAALLSRTLGPVIDADEMIKSVEDLPHLKKQTQTDQAIKKANTMFEDYGRDEARKVFVILTDGRSTDQCETALRMQQFRENHPMAVVLAISVGEMTDDGELRLMASGPENANIESVDDLDYLMSSVDVIVKEICEADGEEHAHALHMLIHNPQDCSVWYKPHYGVYDFFPEESVGCDIWVNTNYQDGLHVIKYSGSVTNMFEIYQIDGQFSCNMTENTRVAYKSAADNTIIGEWTEEDGYIGTYAEAY